MDIATAKDAAKAALDVIKELIPHADTPTLEGIEFDADETSGR